MRFAPLPDSPVALSIWETRVRDYAAYAEANPQVDRAWRAVKTEGVPVSDGPEHPVVMVSWKDARSFCDWLTRKERAAGLLAPTQGYRLPTDLEWSRAAGLPEEPGTNPRERNFKIQGRFPWGETWPPPRGATNIADVTMKRLLPGWPILPGYDDGYATTAPVGKFAPNPLGIYDLSGNVWEWVEDESTPGARTRVLRGGSWCFVGPYLLLSSGRYHAETTIRFDDYGFRCALATTP